MIFRKDGWPLEEEIGGRIFCDKVCLGVTSAFTLLSCDESVLPG